MPTKGFHSEWLTIKEHRILLECRASFPDETMKFIARVAVEFCNYHTDNEARVVTIYYDDKACIWTTTIASTNPSHQELEGELTRVLQGIYADGNRTVDVVIVNAGDPESDHYNHMEHLSIETEVAVDRWRHKDTDYMETVQSPS